MSRAPRRSSPHAARFFGLALLTAAACSDDDGEGLPDDGALPSELRDAAGPDGGDADAGADSAPGDAMSRDAASTATDSSQPDAVAPPQEPAVRFVGRTEQSGDATRFAWSGSGLSFRFSGTEAALRMDDPSGFFTVLIDGAEQPVLATTPGERSYPLASGLPPGEHQLELYRRPEASFGATRFLGLELNDGELLAPPPAKAHRIELIGDSISAGYGNEGADQSCRFEARTENHWLTYGAISARALDAELVTIAWSGKGVVYNYGDDRNDPLPAIYARTIPGEAQSTWDFSKWQPELVVLNLGTNDFSTDSDPSRTVFGDAYDDFLAQIRDNYPDAWIMCLVPTLLGGSDLSNASDYIREVVGALNAAGDARVVVRALAFSTEGFGCDYHPSLATHAAMASALTAEIEALTGW